MSGGEDWWLGSSEPGRVVNRRWRTPRPGDLHPRRRASDRREADAAAARAEATDPFDPSALFAEPATDASEQQDPGAVPPWSELGLRSDATWADVVARHRELAKQHHPDRAGSDPTAARAAAERMATINAAFADLGRIYRISGDR